MLKDNNKINEFNQSPNADSHFLKLFSELCYEVFYNSEHGRKLLTLLENKYFRSPVAIPGQDMAWSFINEGRNELIRSFTMGIQAHMNLSNAKAKTQKELNEALPQKGRPRKPQIRPIR